MPQLMIVAALRRNQVLVQGRHKWQPLTRQHKRSTDRDKTRLHTGMPRLRPCQTHLPTQGGAASALAPVAPYLIQHGVAVIGFARAGNYLQAHRWQSVGSQRPVNLQTPVAIRRGTQVATQGTGTLPDVEQQLLRPGQHSQRRVIACQAPVPDPDQAFPQQRIGQVVDRHRRFVTAQLRFLGPLPLLLCVIAGRQSYTGSHQACQDLST
jgi:hypothetical protein